MFIVIDGCDGTGKTTQTKLLGEWFTERGRNVLLIQEPGTTAVGMQIRKLLKDATLPMSPLGQTLLFAAARAETSKLIREHLAAGGVVIADRWHLSTIVYQGEVQGVPLKTVQQALQVAVGDLAPDLTIVLDIDPEIAMRRRAAEGGDVSKDRFESQGREFQERLRRAYISAAGTIGPNVEVLRIGDDSISSVHNEIMGNVESYLAHR